MPTRLAVISTHPIQYYAPLFRRLAEHENINLHVFYGWTGGTEATYDHGFEQDVAWDIPLLEGYDSTFVPNEARDPGTHHFWGMVNPNLPEMVEKWRADAVLLFGWGWQSHLRVLRYFSGRIPIFFRGDSTLVDETFGPRQWVRRAVLWWVYRYVDYALYVGTRNREYFEAHGLSDEQLHWVPHAIDNDRFADPDGRIAREAHAWRRELGISDEDPAIVFAGKLSQNKAPTLLLSAFNQLDAANAHLIIAGAGPLEDELRRRAPTNTHFLGFQNQSRMPTVYRLGDVFVLPSRSETWGLAINEAMACGRAVVASTQVGCAPDLIDDKENGFVFEGGEEAALAEALQKLLDRPSLRAKMGEASARRIDDWSMGRATQRVVGAVRKHADPAQKSTVV
ncbi:glycosyltransferase family 4 protein [Salinibacter ruber]|uniref:glycosyltransferase family 4 protein n=1 Tax=Salinibacter ruber TaxID=146919 RepID=UPI000E58B8CB|nr:glycosyltransferase family 4 protein [Salinibacter ruber]